MPRLSFKSDASFFRKIAIGAIGVQAAQQDLSSRGHAMAELENGATDTKIWKDVKRKRVRIPDLVCTRCGLRVESRAKTHRVIAMSHSATDAERAWDFGMVDGDIVAFPICEARVDAAWSAEELQDQQSYWHSRERVAWQVHDFINYIRVGDLREVAYSQSSTKGVTEGSETSIQWDAILSTREGVVESTRAAKVSVRRFSDGHRYTWTNRKGLSVVVAEGQNVHEYQILASVVPPLSADALACPGSLSVGGIVDFLRSPERTQRFTGIKLARLRNESQFLDQIQRIATHPHEDLYVQLEGAIYLAKVCGQSTQALFEPYLESPDEQIQLEAVVALSEAATEEAVVLLTRLLDVEATPYFLRSATAWALGKIGTDQAIERLIQAFSDVALSIREEALTALDALGNQTLDHLLARLTDADPSIAAGAAEVLRRQAALPPHTVQEIVKQVRADDVGARAIWPVWLLGQLPQAREYVQTAVADLQDTRPEAHYAITVLWSFVESWIARHWELHPSARMPYDES